MIGGYAAIAQQYSAVTSTIAKTNNKGVASITICRIENVNEDRLTADVFLIEESAFAYNVPLSFATKGYGYGSYFMPLKGEMALYIKTIYGRNYILSSSGFSDNSYGQRIMAGENMLLGYSGAYLKQDWLGNHIVSAASGNMTFYNNNLSNSEFALGREERTLASNIVKGFGINTNKLCGSIMKSNNVRLVNYEEYFSSINSIATYSPSDILISDQIQQAVKNEILNNANDVIMKIENFIKKNNEYPLNINKSDQDIKDEAENFNNNIKTSFKLNKNAKLIIQKGNVVSKQIESLEDIYKLSESDFLKSEQDEDLVFKLSVIDPVTRTEKASITIDSEGNGHIKLKNLKVETEGQCIINGQSF